MIKKDIVNEIAAKCGLEKKRAEHVFEVMIRSIIKGLKDQTDGRVVIKGFGSFKVKTRAARQARTPQTGVMVDLPERKVPWFTPSKHLKEVINQ